MFDALLPWHLAQLAQQYPASNQVFVYKGFPISFVRGVGKLHSLVDTQSVSTDGKLDLDYIDQNVLDYAFALRKASATNSVLFYEEFLKLSQEVRNVERLGRQFVVFENPFYRRVPNQSNHSFVDVEWSIEQNKPIVEDELFCSFYANCFRLGEQEYVQYLTNEATEAPNVCSGTFFTGIDQLPVLSPVTDTQLPEGVISFQSSDNAYQDFKRKVFTGEQIDKPVYLLIDQATIRTKAEKRELAILYFILQQANLSVEFITRQAVLDDSYRPELLGTLQRHWRNADNPEPSFRTLSIYRDPAISRDLMDVSQGSVIEHLVRQAEAAQKGAVYEDIFLTSPTGAGKSVLFQVPGIYLAERYELVTIVVSPLKALMYDQVEALRRERGYNAVAYINSDISLIERQDIIDRIARKEISLLYLSPELLLSYDIRTFIGDRPLGLLVVDEAHLVTTWGRDFRVDYWFLGNYIRKIRRYTTHRFPVLALTATAVHDGPNDLVYQTISSLSMQNPAKYIGNVIRPEISFQIDESPQASGNHEQHKLAVTVSHIKQMVDDGTKSIVYFPWVSQIRDVLALLDQPARRRVAMYYSGVAQADREGALQRFKSGEVLVVLATKAFGMGVDVPDIREVYHHAPSGTLADYVQEFGRLARKTGLTGIASMDYNERDLKFAKVLFGLSSLKQYQVGLVLQKLWNMYRLKRKRNFLVSVDDFAYIFPHDQDPEQKVKSALLVLEKDFLARYNYNVLIVRPKALFSVVYAKVALAEVDAFENRFGSFISRLDGPQRTAKATLYKGKGGGVILPKADTGVCYRIELDKLWEATLPDVSFPKVKQEFFAGTLFEKFNFTSVSPRLQYDLTLDKGWAETLDLLTLRLKQLEQVMHRFQGFFSQEQLFHKLKEEFGDEALARKAANLLTTLYSEKPDFGRNGHAKPTGTNFIQTRKSQKTGETEFQVINSALAQVANTTRQKFSTLFHGLPEAESHRRHYVSTNTEKNRDMLKLAYILEVFDLATYELNGGERPQIFIRVNDPMKIERFATTSYTNSIVQEVHDRQKRSVNLLESFFTATMTDAERWQFIEDYFLGREVGELIEEETGAKAI
ncbi:ATP-dependent DNA helicase RecQ [Fibrella sp. USSR17]